MKEDLFTTFQATNVLTFQSRRVLERLYQGPARGSVVLYPGGRSQRNGYRLNSGTADTCTTATQKYQSNQAKQLVEHKPLLEEKQNHREKDGTECLLGL